ncbi:kinase domain protein [Clostridiales bacterium oral taxon 876 str. F0540]|nr:kinase domain protein [Clostridiales bacterium oral taxon 876 str. F0540]
MLIGKRYSLDNIIKRKNDNICTLWQGSDIKNNCETVAIKVLSVSTKINNQNQIDVKELFRRESDSLSRLKHPNIIGYMDAGIDEDNFYIVTEYFDGYSLDKYIKLSSLNDEEILKIAISILEGLAEAHTNNIVHRDLKPNNILVDEFGNVKIIDFGISKILDLTYDPTETLKDLMTVAYASPEQLLRGSVKFESDYYSFGAILYFMFSKEDPPINREQFYENIYRLTCSNRIKELLASLLQNEPSKRPRSIYHIINEIKKEYIDTSTKGKVLYLKMNNFIPKVLYDLGMIKYPNAETAVTFITNDIKVSSIYKHNNNLYLIGDSIKYHCKMSLDGSHLLIGNINSIDDDFSVKEKEFNRGIEIIANWIVTKQNQFIPDNDFWGELLSQVTDKEKKRRVRLNREQEEDMLLNKWDKYLQEEYQILQKKKRVCNYYDFDYDALEGKLLVSVDTINDDLEKGDLVQLTSKVDQAITVGVIDEIEENTVSINLSPNINLDNVSKRGKIGLDVVQVESSLKRLSKATRAIKLGNSVNPNLIDIIRSPEIVTMNKIVEVNDFFQNIDEANKKAVNMALSTKDIFLIQGPPGTGKTTVITEIVCQILKENPKARILLTSQSHVAVDHAINSISKYLNGEKIIRIGRTDKISVKSESLLMSNQVNKWVDKVKRDSKNEFYNYLKSKIKLNDEELEMAMEELRKNNSIDEDEKNELTNFSILVDQKTSKVNELTVILREWHRRLGNLEEFDEIFAHNASIVAATCLGIASRNILSEMIFDWVIVDEAARATAPELLVPIIKGKKIILVGDHKQLPPVVGDGIDEHKKEEKGLRTSDLEKSLFEELFGKISDEGKIVLTSQYRMHPNISNLIRDVFYPTENIISRKSADERKHYLNWWPKSIVWLNTHSIDNNKEQPVGSSKKNEIEAKVILNCLQKIQQSYKQQSQSASIAVISGYDGQRRILNNLIKPSDHNIWSNLEIEINNVDAFQGSEADIAIYSLVRCNSEGKIGFLSDARRLNVAFSRGKSCLIIVGDAYFAERATSFSGNPFFDVITYIKRNPQNCLMEDIK